MWIWLAIGSAVMLGIYDVAKKQALKRNRVLYVLAASTGLSALLMSPFLSSGQPSWHLYLLLKTLLVTSSWVTGLAAMRSLPLTTVSTIKASRPMFVLILSIIIFGERLNGWQWAGCLAAMLSLYLLKGSSRKEGIDWLHDKGMGYMAVSVATGVASALYDKHILHLLEPLFVQSWTNVYITCALMLLILARRLFSKETLQKPRWDWSILLIAVSITVADCMYFFALSEDGALLSVISMIRRSCVVVTFCLGAAIFREHHIKEKAFDLLIMLSGMALIVFGTV